MQKNTFIFPDYTSLWEFKNQTQAINVTVSPKKYKISGLFSKQEIDLALNQFKAALCENTSVSVKTATDQIKTGWFWSYSINYRQGRKKLKEIVASMQLLKPF